MPELKTELQSRYAEVNGVRLHYKVAGRGKLEVVRVPDATHWVMDEKPDLVNAEIRRFIERQSA